MRSLLTITPNLAGVALDPTRASGRGTDSGPVGEEGSSDWERVGSGRLLGPLPSTAGTGPGQVAGPASRSEYRSASRS